MVDMPDMKPWPRLSGREMGDFRIFSLVEELYLRPAVDGRVEKTHPFYVILSRDWINVVPITPEGRVLLIRQFRSGTEEITIEVPGGMVETTDVDPTETARRELEEESGYRADRIIPLRSVRPNPAILRNWCHLFVATGVRPVGKMNWDEGEEVRPFEATWAEVDELVRSGAINHSIVLNALTFARQYLNASGHP